LSGFGAGAFAIFFKARSNASSESSVSCWRAASLNLSICLTGVVLLLDLEPAQVVGARRVW
jgi:hypothetical protein